MTPIRTANSYFFTEESATVPITHHSDSITKETFSKHYDVELLVHRHVLKHIEHSHRVHGRDDGREQQVLREVYVLHAKSRNLAYGKETYADANAVPQSPHNCEPQHLHRTARNRQHALFADRVREMVPEYVTNRANVLKESPGGHEVA